MDQMLSGECRHFLTYSGIALPLNLVEPLESVAHRNTYFRGFFDNLNRLTACQKMVYGEVETQHRYAYHANGKLKWAEITDADGNVNELAFDELGRPS